MTASVFSGAIILETEMMGGKKDIKMDPQQKIEKSESAPEYKNCQETNQSGTCVDWSKKLPDSD